MIPAPGEALMLNRDASDMDCLHEASVDLVLTSPPYFDEETGVRLKRPRRSQHPEELPSIEAALTEFARLQEPVLREVARVLKPGHALVLQTKDIRHAGVLLPLAALHAAAVRRAGLMLVGRIHWRDVCRSYQTLPPSRHARSRRPFSPADTEEFQVFVKGDGLTCTGEDDEQLAVDARCPLWELPGPGANARHRHGAPHAVLGRFIRLLTLPGDLVLDPYAGGGTTLQVARRLGRRALGMEIDPVIAAQWGGPNPRRRTKP